LHAEHNLLVDRFLDHHGVDHRDHGRADLSIRAGYMREFHEDHHAEFKDRRRSSSACWFVFLGAMYGVVFSNNLIWLYFFWEVTTLVLVPADRLTSRTTNRSRTPCAP